MSAFSTIMRVGKLAFPDVMVVMTEASARPVAGLGLALIRRMVSKQKQA